MRIRYVLGLLAAFAALASCEKEALRELEPESTYEQEPQVVRTVLQVGIGDTKTYLGDSEDNVRKVYWSKGNQVRANGILSDALPEDLPDNTSSVNFSFDGKLTLPYKVVYPESAYTDDTHINLPAIQTYKEGGIADNMLPLAGYSSSGSTISLSHLCAIVKISIKRASTDADTDNIATVRFRGGNAEKVSGTFGISDFETTPKLASESGSKTELEVRVNKSLATSTSKAVEYYLVVPAREYSNGFSIDVIDANGHKMTKQKMSSWTPDAGHLYKMPEFDFVPTSTELGVEIRSAEDLITFATDYNNKVYASLGSSLVATITADADITFDAATSDEFNATGGIGNKAGDDSWTNYFNGIFDGNGHTISGLDATVPLFAYIGSGGTVKNITLSSTCSYTVETSSGSNHGTLVGRNKGIVQGCTSNANVVINNIQDLGTASQYYGGLVGINAGGTIDGCNVAGDITCSQTGQLIEIPGQDNAVSIGGIVGFTESDGGSINNCKFQGNITVSDDTTYGGITTRTTGGSNAGLYFYVGGILGRAEKGIVTGCYAGIDGTPKAIDVRGTFVPAVGGIIGWNVNSDSSEIRGNYNYMSLSFASSGARAQTTPCRIGGIAARSVVKIEDCHNYGTVSSTCNSTTLYLGGIAGDGCDIEECTNYASGAITRNNANETGAQANRYMRMGGIMGAPSAASTISSCKNYASVTSNELGTSTATTIEIGGVVGGGNGKKLTINGCSNEGEVKLENDNPSAVAVTYNALGGIVGYVSTAGTTVESCDNSGKIWCNNNAAGSYGPISIGGTIGCAAAVTVVTDCTNDGEILCQNPGAAISAYVDLGGIVGYAETTITISGTTADATQNSGTVTVAQASSNVLYARNTQGGILGYGKGSNTSITNCKNTNQIYCNLTGVVANNRPSYTGGIVGILANLTYTDNAATTLGALTGVEIGNCENTGKVNSSNYNNRGGNKVAPFAGGIVGLVCGTNKSLASIHDCTVGNQTVYMYRGASGGGIIGYANYCNIEDCTSSADMSGMNASVSGVGGIVGRMFDSEMSECTFSGKIARAKNIGGLVYTMSEQQSGSSISNCKVNGATLTTGTATDKTEAAVLVSITDNKTNAITNCGIKGTLNSAAITLSSNMITTDGGATVTGTYLLP